MALYQKRPRKMKNERTKTETELKKDAFKSITDFNYLYINEKGKVYSIKTGKYLQPTPRNYVKTENKYLKVPKLVLMAFNGEPIRNGKILYIDGNTANLSRQNLKYSRLFTIEQTNKVNKADLLTAIRCYIRVYMH